MHRSRPSITGLMAVVLVAAFGLAGLRSASLLWTSAIFTLTVAVLTASLLGILARRGRARIAWAGFALFGWVYFVTAFVLWYNANGVIAPPYLTKPILDRAVPLLGVPLSDLYEAGPQGAVEFPTAKEFNLRHYRQIGQCLACLAFGGIGALTGWLLSRPGRLDAEV